MANQTTTNPIIYDTTTGASWTGSREVMQAQWVDDNADIADNATLAFTVNGATVTVKVQRGATPDSAGVLYGVGPFPKAMEWNAFTLSTMTAGAFIIWCAD